jgi:hypothetical protein
MINFVRIFINPKTLSHELNNTLNTYTVNPVILIRHTEFHMQPTSAGLGIGLITHMECQNWHNIFSFTVDTFEANEHILCLIRLSAKIGPIGFTVYVTATF